MKRICLAVALLCSATSCSINEAFVNSVEAAWDVMEPEYVRYIDQDATLSDASKVTRKRTAALLRSAINKAKGDDSASELSSGAEVR